MLSIETIDAIEDHKKRMEKIRRQANNRKPMHLERRIARLIRRGYGWEDLVFKLQMTREEARAAVLGRGK
jgi:SOS response regulatory protein OraA/RecX